MVGRGLPRDVAQRRQGLGQARKQRLARRRKHRWRDQHNTFVLAARILERACELLHRGLPGVWPAVDERGAQTVGIVEAE